MKILQLIDSLNSGGAERMCVNIANALHYNGYEVQVCASRKGGPLETCISPGIKCHFLIKGSFFDVLAFRKFINILKTEKIDIIHAHSSSLFWAVAAKYYLKSLKVIWHDHLGARPKDQKKNRFYKMLSYNVDGIIAVNEELASWSRMHMKVPTERIVVKNNFPLLRKVPRKADPNYFTIVCLANLRPEKDHETLVRALDILKKRPLLINLKVIFAGTYSEDEYFFRLKKMIDDLRLGDIIEIIGSVEDTAALLAGADCGVLSSISEGLPVSLLEYGMAGLPVVVTDTGHCAKAVGYGEFGKVVPSGNPGLLAEALEDYITERDELSNFGRVFREHIIKNYGPERFINEYITFINTL